MLLRKVSLLIESNIKGAQINHNHLTLCLELWIAKKTHQECNRYYLSILQKRKHLSNAFFIFLKDEILKILIVRFVDMHKFTTARSNELLMFCKTNTDDTKLKLFFKDVHWW